MAVNEYSGIIFLKVGEQLLKTKGAFKVCTGEPKREAVVSSSYGTVGFKLVPQVSYIEGEIYDYKEFDIEQLFKLSGATITLETSNGKVFCMTNGCYTGDGVYETDEGSISVRFESESTIKVI